MMDFFEEKFVPVAAKIGSQRHLVAVRDGFASLMPLLIAGSFAVLINNLPIPGYAEFMAGIFGDSWTAFGGNIWWGTFAVISMFLTFTVAYYLAKGYGKDGLSAGLISLASYFIIIPQVSPTGGWGDISWSYLSSVSMFVAILVALVSCEIFTKLSKSDKLTIKMPEGVPPAVSRSFAALFPGIITLAIFSFIMIALTAKETNMFDLINTFVAAPIREVADSYGSAVTIVFLNHFLWFFGLHGSNILGGIIEPVLLPLLDANAAAVAAGTAPVHIVTKPFLDAFVYMGGSGTTLGLLIAIFLGSKQKQEKEIAKLGIAPGFFNINEPVIFGMPLVLNPWYVIPFIFGPVILVTVAYFAMATGLVPKTVVLIPWTFPPVIGGLMSTASIRGGLLAGFNLFLSIIIYLPFVKLASRDAEKKNAVD